MSMCFIMMLYQLFYSYTRLQCKGPCPCVLVRGKRKRKRKGSTRQRNRTGANKNNQKWSNRTPEANQPSAPRQSTRPKSLPPATNHQNIATPEMPLTSPDGTQPSSMKASVPIPRSDPGLVQNNQQIVQPRPVIQGGRIGTSYFENIDQLKVVSNKNSQPYIRSNMGPSNEYAPVYLKYKNDTKPFTKSLNVRVISQTSTYKQGKNTGHKSNKQEKVYSESNSISLKSNTRASDSFKHEPKYKTDSGSSLSGNTKAIVSQQDNTGSLKTKHRKNTPIAEVHQRTQLTSSRVFKPKGTVQLNNAGTPNINKKGMNIPAAQVQQRASSRQFQLTGDIRVKTAERNNVDTQNTIQKEPHTPAFNDPQGTQFTPGRRFQPIIDTRVETSQQNSAGTQNTIQKGINTPAVDIPPRTLYSSNMNVQQSDSIRVQTSQRNNAGTKNINQKGISPSAFQGQQRTQFTPGRHFKQPRNLHLGITKDIVGQNNVASAQFTNQKRINTPAFEVQQHTEFKSGTNLQPTWDTRVQTSQPNSAGTQNTIKKGLNTPAVDIPPRTLYSSDTSVKQSDSIRVQTSRRNNAGIKNTNQRRLNVPPIASQQHTQHKADSNFQRSGNLQSGSTKAFVGHQISESTENNNWRGMGTPADGTQQPTQYTPGRNVQQSGHSQPGSTKTIAGQGINAGNQNTGRKIKNTPDFKTQQRPQFIPGRNIQQLGNARVHTQSGQSINVGLSKTNERDFSQNNPTGGILAVYDLTDFQGGPVDPKPVAEKTKFQGVKSGLTETRQPKIKSKPDLLPSNRQGDKKIWSRSAGSHITDLRKVEHKNQRTNSGTRKPAAQGLPINMNPDKAIPQNADNRKVNHATVGTSNRQNKSVSKYQVDTNLVSSQIPRKTSITKSSGKQRHPKTSNSKSENTNMTTKDDSIPTEKQSSDKSRNTGKPQTFRGKQQQDKPLKRRLTIEQTNVNSEQANVNSGQTNVNREQVSGNSEQANVNSEQANVNSEQANVNSKQASVNSEQANVNSKQANINNEQANVDSEQANVNSFKKRRRPKKKNTGCICPGSIKRVCGKDGKTYKNACKMKCS